MEEDSQEMEELEIPLGTDEYDWECGDRLFLTRLLPKQCSEDV